MRGRGPIVEPFTENPRVIKKLLETVAFMHSPWERGMTGGSGLCYEEYVACSTRIKYLLRAT